MTSNSAGSAQSPMILTQLAMQPRPWAAAGWLCLFFIFQNLGSILYIAGYGGYLGAQLGAQGEVLDPASMQSQVAVHIQTPAAFAGMYITQFFLVLPVLLWAANFKEQSYWNTLNLRTFAYKFLWLWVLLLLAFLATQSFVLQMIELEPGEFLQGIAGSRHLLLALVFVLVAPLLEELIFRGYLFRAWRHTRLGFSGTLLLTSALFTAMHLGQYHWIHLSFVFVLSLMLGFAREKSGSVLLPILLHALNNFASAVTVIYLGLQ
ncbi:CPBP family intramembrane glutamic endopeptidase [Microbulbifer pacificus]|uniref:CPBP family intramembrane glutamic endopeptidase n=1 Tax=Microbulbifer pacificus TaxID=407164 RepID=UPI000CF54029|nr:type II CAAX endopeptidase family protein [Microbulbifer pacificus]